VTGLREDGNRVLKLVNIAAWQVFKFRVMVWLFDEFGGIGQPLDSRWEGKVIDPEYLSEFACYPKSRCV
jgi:hypothetical protein